MALARCFDDRQFIAIDPFRTKLQVAFFYQTGDGVDHGSNLPSANAGDVLKSFPFREKLQSLQSRSRLLLRRGTCPRAFAILPKRSQYRLPVQFRFAFADSRNVE